MKQKNKGNHKLREQHLLILAVLAVAGCAGSDSSSLSPKVSSTSNASTSVSPIAPLPAASQSSWSNSFDSINRQMAQDAQASRAQEDKRLLDSRSRLEATLAHQASENDKNREIQRGDQLTQLILGLGLTGVMSSAMSNSKCPSRTSYKSLIDESREAFAKAEPSGPAKPTFQASSPASTPPQSRRSGSPTPI
jgi:hypothetical protein